MRMQPAGEHGAAPARDAVGHQDRLGRPGRAVIHGGIGDLHPGECGHLGLELEQILQRALGDFGLVGSVAGQEFGALDQMVDARRNMVLVGAGTAEERHRARRHIAPGHAAEDALHFHLALVPRQVGRR